MQVWHKRSKPLTGKDLDVLPIHHKQSEWAVVSVFLTEGYEKVADTLNSADNDMLNGDPFLYKLGIHDTR
jgi:hypothetical protein